MKVGVLGGLGEVGSAIAKCYEHPLIKDLKTDEFENDMEIMHICIPYKNKKQFYDIVIPVIKKYRPYMSVIHSTVGIGTTENLYGMGYPVVHSPMRGVHPDLYGGLMNFVKYIGYEDETIAIKVSEHFEELGINTHLVSGSKNTEAGKLWSTTQYFANIIIEKHLYRFCKVHDLDFNVVYTEFNRSYNHGYEKLQDNRFRKYILKHMEGGVGGHCCAENATILMEEFDDTIASFMLKQNERFTE